MHSTAPVLGRLQDSFATAELRASLQSSMTVTVQSDMATATSNPLHASAVGAEPKEEPGRARLERVSFRFLQWSAVVSRGTL